MCVLGWLYFEVVEFGFDDYLGVVDLFLGYGDVEEWIGGPPAADVDENKRRAGVGELRVVARHLLRHDPRLVALVAGVVNDDDVVEAFDDAVFEDVEVAVDCICLPETADLHPAPTEWSGDRPQL